MIVNPASDKWLGDTETVMGSIPSRYLFVQICSGMDMNDLATNCYAIRM